MTLRPIRWFAAGATVALASACGGGRTAVPTAVPVVTPEVRYQRLLEDGARAEQAGRRDDALRAYLDVAHGTGRVAEAREAFLRAGLLRLVANDVVEGARLVREAAARHPDGQEPLSLLAVQVLLGHLDAAERGAAVNARDLTAREDELRSLRRTVATLRTQLEKRDEALKKAAAAAVGTTRPR